MTLSSRCLSVLHARRLLPPAASPSLARWIRSGSAAASRRKSPTANDLMQSLLEAESEAPPPLDVDAKAKAAADAEVDGFYRAVMEIPPLSAAQGWGTEARLERAPHKVIKSVDKASGARSQRPLAPPSVGGVMDPRFDGQLDAAGSPGELIVQTARLRELLQTSDGGPRRRYRTALQYIERLEQTPMLVDPSLYLTLFDFIRVNFTDRQYVALDLFDRIRLVSHPNPPVEIWNEVLRASASGPNPSAERALDLFQEMQAPGSGAEEDVNVETYAHVVRALCKARKPPRRHGTNRTHALDWYSVAWRVVRTMVGAGFTPTRGVCLSLLEGAKRVGDVGRAKGVYGLMKSLDAAVSTDPDCDDLKALTLVLNTYGSYQMPGQRPTAQASLSRANREPVRKGMPVTTDPVPTPTTGASVTPEMDLLASNSLPLPRASEDLLREVDALVAPHLRRLSQHPEKFSGLVAQRRIAFLHTAYLGVYAAHANTVSCKSLYDRITHDPLAPGSEARRGKAPRMTTAYIALLSCCERTKSATRAGSVGTAAFKEWKESLQWQERFERTKYVFFRDVGLMWGSWMRLQAKFGGAREAYNDLLHFVSMYPPNQPIEQQPYIETYVLDGVAERLRDQGDVKRANTIKRITNSYKAAWKQRNSHLANIRRKDREALVHNQIVHPQTSVPASAAVAA